METHRRGSHDDVIPKDLLDGRAHQLEALPVARGDWSGLEPSRVFVPDLEPHLATVRTLALAVLASLLRLVEGYKLEVVSVCDREERLGNFRLGLGDRRCATRGRVVRRRVYLSGDASSYSQVDTVVDGG
jgi:hypothetical protein